MLSGLSILNLAFKRMGCKFWVICNNFSYQEDCQRRHRTNGANNYRFEKSRQRQPPTMAKPEGRTSRSDLDGQRTQSFLPSTLPSIQVQQMTLHKSQTNTSRMKSFSKLRDINKPWSPYLCPSCKRIRVHRSQQWRDLITCFKFHCLEREEHTWRVSTWETLVRLLHHRGWINTNDVSLCVIILFKKMITQFKRVRDVYEWIRAVWQFSWKFTLVLNRKLKTGNTNV